MKQYTIKTPVVGHDHLFHLFAVAKATRLPILVIGHPGIAKTKMMLDFVRSLFINPADPIEKQKLDLMNRTFILELDAGTRPSAIKGMPDMQKLTTGQGYEVISPIADADAVMINEVDKGTSEVRNSMLSVMNERMLMNGREKKVCKWDVFCATANEIPSDEKNSPFWDRFAIKVHLNRLDGALMQQLLLSGLTTNTITVNVPDAVDMAKVQFSTAQIKVVHEILHAAKGVYISDRTMIRAIGQIAPAVACVFNISTSAALIKTVELIGSLALAEEVSRKLEPQEVINVRSKIKMLASQTQLGQFEQLADGIRLELGKLAKAKKLDGATISELYQSLGDEMKKSTLYEEYSQKGANAMNPVMGAPIPANP